MKKFSAIALIAMLFSCTSHGQDSTYAALKSFCYSSVGTYIGSEREWAATLNDDGSVTVSFTRGNEERRQSYSRSEKTLSGEAAREFVEKAVGYMKAAGVLKWKGSYVNPHVLDGTMWHAEFFFGDDFVSSGGSNDWPRTFGDFRPALELIDSILKAAD